MPTECITNPLQRELADSIIRMVPLDEIRILLACGAKVNEPVTQGLRPLHYAVWQRYLEAAQLLLVRGSDINARDECGYSALHLSAEHGWVHVVHKELCISVLESEWNMTVSLTKWRNIIWFPAAWSKGEREKNMVFYSVRITIIKNVRGIHSPPKNLLWLVYHGTVSSKK